MPPSEKARNSTIFSQARIERNAAGPGIALGTLCELRKARPKRPANREAAFSIDKRLPGEGKIKTTCVRNSENAGVDMYEEVSSVDAEEASHSAEDIAEGFVIYSAYYYFSTEEDLLKGAREYAEYLLQQDGAQLTSEYPADEIFTSADTADASITVDTEKGPVQLVRVGVDEDGKYVMMIVAQLSGL